MSSAICFNLDQSKILLSGNGLSEQTVYCLDTFYIGQFLMHYIGPVLPSKMEYYLYSEGSSFKHHYKHQVLSWSVLGQDTSELQPRTDKTDDIHKYMNCYAGMTELMW